MRITYTAVGRCKVAVRDAHLPTLWKFTGGAHGKKEAGVFAFWTTVIKKKGKKRVWGRALYSLPPGDRFDRMRFELREAKSAAARSAYRRIWRAIKGGKAISYIRPSSDAEVMAWMRSHKSDAKYAKRLRT